MASAKLNILNRTDASAISSSHEYSVAAGVNGPIEVQRRDELPEEAAIDVTIRPLVGVGGVRERHLESIIQNTLRHVILVSAHPRTLIQITLQVVACPTDDSTLGGLPQASSNLPILPALVQSSILALLSASIPMSMAMTTTLITVQYDGELVADPTSDQIKTATSIHVLAFSSHGDLLIVESEGDFSIETWLDVHDKASQICHGNEESDSDSEDISMAEDGATKLEDVLRDAVGEKIVKERKWKESHG